MTVQVGDIEWLNLDNEQLEYQWQRCNWLGTACTDIDSETDQTYTLSAEDQGGRVRVRVAGHNSGGTAAATSGATTVIGPANPSLEGGGVEFDESERALKLYGAGGANETTVASCADVGVPAGDSCGLVDAELSPDHQMVAFVVTQVGEEPHLWVANRDGTGRRDLGIGESPTWSYDGLEIVVVKPDPQDAGRTHVFSVRADGANAADPEQLTDGAGSENDPRISPDGSTLTYAKTASDDWRRQIASANADGDDETVHPLPGSTISVGDFVWAGDGSALYFESEQDQDNSPIFFRPNAIMRVDRDGTNAVRLTPHEPISRYGEEGITYDGIETLPNGQVRTTRSKWVCVSSSAGSGANCQGVTRQNRQCWIVEPGTPRPCNDDALLGTAATVTTPAQKVRGPKPRPEDYQPTFYVSKNDGFWPTRVQTALDEWWDDRRTCVVPRSGVTWPDSPYYCSKKDVPRLSGASLKANRGKGKWLDYAPANGKRHEQWNAMRQALGFDHQEFSMSAGATSKQWAKVYASSAIYTYRGKGLKKAEVKKLKDKPRGSIVPTARSLQYWAYYPYNYQEGKGKILGKHEGDWELVTILFDGWNLPRYVLMSRHEEDSALYKWQDEQLQRQASGGILGPPKVYVAKGSHAAYAKCGSFGLSAGGADPGGVIRPDDHACTAPLLELAPKRTRLIPLSAGGWGCRGGRFGANRDTLPGRGAINATSPQAPLRQQGLFEGGTPCD